MDHVPFACHCSEMTTQHATNNVYISILLQTNSIDYTTCNNMNTFIQFILKYLVLFIKYGEIYQTYHSMAVKGGSPLTSDAYLSGLTQKTCCEIIIFPWLFHGFL